MVSGKHKSYLRIVVLTCAFLSALFFLHTDVFAASGVTSGTYEDRVYVFSMKGENNPSSDMILVESNGHYGLIDTSNNIETTITDEEGNTYDLPESEALSDPVNNGVRNASYMISSLGITHLDFIIGTHSHSDHIGGVAEIARMTYEGIRLVDENTVYFYKDYHKMNYKEDVTWADGAFAYQSQKAMEEAGATLVSLNQNYYGEDVTSGLMPDYTESLNALSEHPGIREAYYEPGDPSDEFDDYFAFRMGDFSLKLYNLFSVNTMINENVNSICTVITKGEGQSFVSLSDINNDQRVGQKIAHFISKDLNGARVAVLKDAHHGIARGSNTKEEADLYRPVYDISSKAWETSTPNNNFANFMYYCGKNFGTVFYASGDSEHAVAAVFDDDGVSVRQVAGRGSLARLTEPVVNDRTTYDGWHIWDYEFTVYNNDKPTLVWTYFRDGVPLTGFQQINDAWYYFDADGFMQTGWIRIGKNWYYLNADGSMQFGWFNGNGLWKERYYLDPLSGAALTGWQKIDGETYYFDTQGALLTGWQYIDGEQYCLDDSGALRTDGWVKMKGKWYFLEDKSLHKGWLRNNGNWYYLDPYEGVMVTGLYMVEGKTYFFNAAGIMKTGWQKADGLWYYFEPSGAARTNTWIRSGNSWYYLTESGAAKVGWLNLKGSWYYFSEDSVMRTGWVFDGNDWYYMNASGVMQTGWIKNRNTWYLLKPTGVMAAGEWVDGYWLNSSGSWTYLPRGSWRQDANGWWYGDTSGWYAKNETIRIDNVYYRFNGAGYWSY